MFSPSLSFRGTRNPHKKLYKDWLLFCAELLVGIPRSSEWQDCVTFLERLLCSSQWQYRVWFFFLGFRVSLSCHFDRGEKSHTRWTYCVSSLYVISPLGRNDNWAKLWNLKKKNQTRYCHCEEQSNLSKNVTQSCHSEERGIPTSSSAQKSSQSL